ncbi:NUDIX hydrolase [Anaerococcus lactolyticus]|uniref:NUDIX hydrolase n=1 Tax=Anaerococcus lactolyticus S7-1-13 TaxID=1284686 RepID=A0A095WZW9_9FIRM|nr:NUDIX domain-containing protein [Anaerococcus lactolyticus]KGF03330.1 NUDIX hydrolase [Anaerococcus lactolyticus S7-1-13]
MDQDCGFSKGDKWFRYRAAAIIVEDDCVLFAGNEVDDYYYSIGGGVHLGESSEEAVKREAFEETGVQYEVDYLAIIHENIFIGTSDLEGSLCHEISFYYMMKPKGNKNLNSHSLTKGGLKESMHWLPIDKLEKYKAYPTFMKEYLKSDHKGIEHIITDERD